LRHLFGEEPKACARRLKESGSSSSRRAAGGQQFEVKWEVPTHRIFWVALIAPVIKKEMDFLTQDTM